MHWCGRSSIACLVMCASRAGSVSKGSILVTTTGREGGEPANRTPPTAHGGACQPERELTVQYSTSRVAKRSTVSSGASSDSVPQLVSVPTERSVSVKRMPAWCWAQDGMAAFVLRGVSSSGAWWTLKVRTGFGSPQQAPDDDLTLIFTRPNAIRLRLHAVLLELSMKTTLRQCARDRRDVDTAQLKTWATMPPELPNSNADTQTSIGEAHRRYTGYGDEMITVCREFASRSARYNYQSDP
ncbi:uncharacterized protein MYCFIDRAFT_171681 [Pseudocercospora fijiensis CIRAD86]|uniref:Secreted protein n=1 Tax=Pseudocercospora fijiensis (strain CIRAD86) TaxID=383855 RepID=M3B907_PSEFD|nr:uncharacterized protein MYCFIDRAFT_171681 [Pseudocercospora fijiensis CIRAD86]EME85812.1 hypothetical protein MYCFIDRAFT_171681 [Pseudocercospora fijiensis CIRAD86]